MTTADAIYELVRAMPEEQASLVLMFAQFTQYQRQASLVVNAEMQQDTESWQALVQKLSGAWPDFPSAEELRGGLGQNSVRESL